MSETVYTVKAGDSLSLIADRYGVSGGYQKLAQYNGITNPNIISIGQKIRIPGTTSPQTVTTSTQSSSSSDTVYIVKSGDSLSAIASRFSVAGGYQALAKYNNISNPNIISVGQQIRIPNTNNSSQTSASQQSSTITAGSTVTITGSSYSTGQPIPGWVKAGSYTISEVRGNKALLKEIYSWVNLSDLSLKGSTSTQQQKSDDNKPADETQKPATEAKQPEKKDGKVEDKPLTKYQQLLVDNNVVTNQDLINVFWRMGNSDFNTAASIAQTYGVNLNDLCLNRNGLVNKNNTSVFTGSSSQGFVNDNFSQYTENGVKASNDGSGEAAEYDKFIGIVNLMVDATKDVTGAETGVSNQLIGKYTKLEERAGLVNVVGIRGYTQENGVVPNTFNEYNDTIVALWLENSNGALVKHCKKFHASVDPGLTDWHGNTVVHLPEGQMNYKGGYYDSGSSTYRINPDDPSARLVGFYDDNRDGNISDNERTGNSRRMSYAVQFHRGWNYANGKVNGSSAGCQVIKDGEYGAFFQIMKDLYGNSVSNWHFRYTLLNGSAVANEHNSREEAKEKEKKEKEQQSGSIYHLDQDKLSKVASGANKYYSELINSMDIAKITTKQRACCYVAQLAHESGNFYYMEEIASGAAYEGRTDLGNTQPGDGKRFKGRGPIQITGRANYTQAAKDLNLDLVNHPELASNPEIGFKLSAWYWNTRSLNSYCDNYDFTGLTRKINGGTNGLQDRLNYYNKANTYF
jgi:predicted chitinase/LysM repeat protein